jgi:hypothetical protein
VRIRAYTHAERPELEEAWDEVVGGAWPPFLHHDEVCNRNWWRLTTTFGPFQVYLVDEEDGRVVGWGNAIPFAWNGETASLPDGVRGVLPLGISGRDG